MRKPTHSRALTPTPPNFKGLVFTLAFLVFFFNVLININQENTILRERERERERESIVLLHNSTIFMLSVIFLFIIGPKPKKSIVVVVDR